MNETKAYYDDFSEGYERERAKGYHRLIDDLEMEIALPLAAGRRVLEAGCGTGLLLQRLAKEADSACGFDLSPGMVRRARARGLNVVIGDMTRIPFADSAFELVCSFKVLAHVVDIGSAMEELARVTAPGGRMLLEFYNPWSLRYLAKRVAGPQRISGTRTEADVHTRWDPPTAIRQLLPAGVELDGLRGVRVFTPAAFVHKLPVAARALGTLERAAMDSPLRYFGGFLLALLSKHT